MSKTLGIIIGAAILLVAAFLFLGRDAVELTLSANKQEISWGDTLNVDYAATNKGGNTYSAEDYIWDLGVEPTDEAVSFPIHSFRKVLGPKETFKDSYSWQVDTGAFSKREGLFNLVFSLAEFNEADQSRVIVTSTRIPISITNSLKNAVLKVSLSDTENIGYNQLVKVSYSIENKSTVEIGARGTKIELGYRPVSDPALFAEVSKIKKTALPGETLEGTYSWRVDGIPTQPDNEFVLRITNDDPQDFELFTETSQQFTFIKI